MSETNVEFIQRIKEKVNPKPGRAYESVMIEVTDMNRLIEQAEYVQDLEEALKVSRLNAEYQHDRKHINMDRVIELEKENERYREALQEIAKGINDYYEHDNAQIALDALEGVSNGD